MWCVVRQIVEISMHRSNSFHGQFASGKNTFTVFEFVHNSASAPRLIYVSIQVASPLMYFCIMSIIWLFK
jgi:hypothetical protein